MRRAPVAQDFMGDGVAVPDGSRQPAERSGQGRRSCYRPRDEQGLIQVWREAPDIRGLEAENGAHLFPPGQGEVENEGG
jgi:hypothetical protein